MRVRSSSSVGKSPSRNKMGGSQSSEDTRERAAVVNRVENEHGEVTVEITEELMRDIHQKVGGGVVDKGSPHSVRPVTPLKEDSPTVHQQQDRRAPLMVDSEAELLLQLEEERFQNKEYKNVTEIEIGKTSYDIQQKLSQTPLARVAPICASLAQTVSHCYASNPGRTLDCSQEVKEYKACVDQQMKVQRYNISGETAEELKDPTVYLKYMFT